MEKYLEVEEDTEFYRGRAQVMESCCKGMILIQLLMTDKTTDDLDSAGIRLTRTQARQVANHLNNLADQLFFEEQESKKGANETI